MVREIRSTRLDGLNAIGVGVGTLVPAPAAAVVVTAAPVVEEEELSDLYFFTDPSS